MGLKPSSCTSCCSTQKGLPFLICRARYVFIGTIGFRRRIVEMICEESVSFHTELSLKQAMSCPNMLFMLIHVNSIQPDDSMLNVL